MTRITFFLIAFVLSAQHLRICLLRAGSVRKRVLEMKLKKYDILLRIYTVTAVFLSIELGGTLCYRSNKTNTKGSHINNRINKLYLNSTLKSDKVKHSFERKAYHDESIVSYNIKFPRNVIFSPEYYYTNKQRQLVNINGTKRDILLLPQVDPGVLTGQATQVLQNQLYQSSSRILPQENLDLSGSRRQNEFVDYGYVPKGQAMGYVLTTDDKSYGTTDDRSYPDSSYILPQSSAQIAHAPSESTRAIFEDSVPSDLLKMQGVQETEETLVGKLITNNPPGVAPKTTTDTTVAQPQYTEGYRNVVDNILLDKLLNPRTQKNNVSCNPVAVAASANCTNSTDSLCHDNDLGAFRRHGATQHQSFRNVHSTPPLELNDVLNQEAQMYAEKLSNSKLAYSDPKDRPGQGENIAVRCSDDKSLLTAREAVSYWYNKVCKNDFDFNENSPELSQFAQVVWKGSNFLGLGRTTKKRGDLLCTYIVARYSPQATKNGFVENVPTGDFDENGFCSKKCLSGKPDEVNEKENVTSKDAYSTFEENMPYFMEHNKQSRQEEDQSSNNVFSRENDFNEMYNSKPMDKNDDHGSSQGSKIVSVPMIIKSVGHVIVPGSSNMTADHAKFVTANSRQMKNGYGNRNPAFVSFHTDHDTHVFENLRENGDKDHEFQYGDHIVGKQHKHLQQREEGLAHEKQEEKTSKEEIKKLNDMNHGEEPKKYFVLNTSNRETEQDTVTLPNDENELNRSINKEDKSHQEMNKFLTSEKDVKMFGNKNDIDDDQRVNQDNSSLTENASLIKTDKMTESSLSPEVPSATKQKFGKSNKKEMQESSPDVSDRENQIKPDIMVFINKSANEVEHIQEKMKAVEKMEKSGSNQDEKTLPIVETQEKVAFHESLTQREPSALPALNNGAADLDVFENATNKTADLDVLEKATNKTKEPTTRHMLQNFFENVQQSNSDTSPRYIQLIPSKELNEFRYEITKKHNDYRAIHGSPPLILDNDLSRAAQLYAAYAAKHATVAHSDMKTRPDMGESVAEMCTKEGVLPTAEHVVNRWYSEICNPGYDFTNNGKQPGTGHFTQIIWKDSKRLGVGLAIADSPNGDSCSYVVTRYQNAGNYLDKFKENVLAGSFVKSRCADGSNFDKDIDPILGNLKGNLLPSPSYLQSAMKREKTLKGKNKKVFNGTKRLQAKYMLKRLESIKPHILDEILTQYKGPTYGFLENKSKVSFDRHGINSVSYLAAKESATSPRKLATEAEVEEEPQSKSVIIRKNKGQSIQKDGSSAVVPKLNKRDVIPVKNRGHVRHKTKIKRRIRRDVLEQNIKNGVSIITAMNDLESINKRSHIKSRNKKVAKKKKKITDDDKIIGIAIMENIRSSKTKNANIKNVNKHQYSPKLNVHTAKNQSYSAKLAKPSKNVPTPRNITKNDIQFLSAVSNDELKKTGKPKKPKSNFLQNAKSTSLNREEIEKELNTLLNLTADHQVGQPAKKKNFKLKVTKASSVSKVHLFPLEKNITKVNPNTNMNKYKIPKKQNQSSIQVKSPKQISNKSREKDSKNDKAKILNTLRKNTTVDKTNAKNVKDDDLEKYLKSIVVKLHNFDKTTNERNKEKFDSEIKTFAILNEKAIQSKSVQSSHGQLDKQSTIPNAPLKNLEKLAYEINKRRTFESALIDPLDTSIETYVKGLTKATTDKSLPEETKKRLVKINNVLKTENFGSDMDSNTDYPTSQELDSLAKFYDQDLMQANIVASTLSPTKQNIKSTRSNLRTEKMKDAGGHNQLVHSALDEDESEDQSEKEVDEMEEDNLVPDKNDSFQRKNLENASQQLESLASIEKISNSKSIDGVPATLIKTGKLLGGNTSPAKTGFADRVGIEMSPDEIKAINHEAEVVGNHITNSIFYHDNKNHPTYFKPIKKSEKISNQFQNESDVKETLQHAVQTFDVNKATDQWLDEAEKLEKSGPHSYMKIIENIPKSDEPLLQYDGSGSGEDTDEMYNDILEFTPKNKKKLSHSEKGTTLKEEAKKAMPNDGDENPTTDEISLKFKHLKNKASMHEAQERKEQHEYKNNGSKTTDTFAEKYKEKSNEEHTNKAMEFNNKNAEKDQEEKEKPTVSKEDVREKEETAPISLITKSNNNKSDNGDDMQLKPVTLKRPDLKKKPSNKILQGKFKNVTFDTAVLNKPLGSQPVMQGQSDILTDDEFQNADENNLGGRPSDPSPLQQSALMAHNKLRRIHHAPALELSEELSTQAQKYADGLVLKHKGVLVDSPFESRLDQGENLAINCDPQDMEMTGEEASYKWYSEICEHGYDFNLPPVSTQGTEHFSQLIWKASRYFGIGKHVTKRNGMTCTIIVARYQPQGNIPEQTLKNVDEGDFDGSVCDDMTTKAMESSVQDNKHDVDMERVESTISAPQTSLNPVIMPPKQMPKERPGTPKLNSKSSPDDENGESPVQGSMDIKHMSKSNNKLGPITESKSNSKVVTILKSDNTATDKTSSNSDTSSTSNASIQNSSPIVLKESENKMELSLDSTRKPDSEQSTTMSFYLPHKTLHLSKNAFEDLDQHEMKDTGKTIEDITVHSHKEKEKEREELGKYNQHFKDVKHVERMRDSEKSNDDCEDHTESTQVVHVSLSAPPTHSKLDNENNKNNVATGNDHKQKENDKTIENDSLGYSQNLKTDHGIYKVKNKKILKDVAKMEEQKNREEFVSDIYDGNEAFADQVKIGKSEEVLTPMGDVSNETLVLAPAFLRKSHKEVKDTTSLLLHPNEKPFRQKGNTNTTAGYNFEEHVQGAPADLLQQNPHLLQKTRKLISSDSAKIQVPNLRNDQTPTLSQGNNDNPLISSPKINMKNLGSGDLLKQVSLMKEKSHSDDQILSTNDGAEKAVKIRPMNQHNDGAEKVVKIRPMNLHSDGAEKVVKIRPMNVSFDTEQNNKEDGDVEYTKIGAQETGHHKQRPGDTNKVPEPAEVNQEDEPFQQVIPTKKPETPLEPIPEKGDQKPSIPLSEEMEENAPVVLEPTHHPPMSFSVAQPITKPRPTEEPILPPKPISSPVAEVHPQDETITETSEAIGPSPSFGFASFGSPVILHLGDTGYFEDPGAFLRIGLTVHNKLRKIHGSPPMKIDPMLTMQALQHAHKLSQLGFLKHQSMDTLMGMGENLLLGCYDGEYDISAEEAVLRWYAEVCHPGYCFNQTTICSGTGHFSQVVWANSTRLGMAKATRMQNGLRCTYVVARYFPGGNENIAYNDNVKVGKFEEKKICKDVFKTLLTFSTRNEEKVEMMAREKYASRLEFLEKLRQAEQQTLNQIDIENKKTAPLPPVSSIKGPASPHRTNEKPGADNKADTPAEEEKTKNEADTSANQEKADNLIDNGVVDIKLNEKIEDAPTTQTSVESAEQDNNKVDIYAPLNDEHKWTRQPESDQISQQSDALVDSQTVHVSLDPEVKNSHDSDQQHDNQMVLHKNKYFLPPALVHSNALEVNSLQNTDPGSNLDVAEVAEIKRLEEAVHKADQETSKSSEIKNLYSAVENMHSNALLTVPKVDGDAQNRGFVARERSAKQRHNDQEQLQKHVGILAGIGGNKTMLEDMLNTDGAKNVKKSQQKYGRDTADEIRNYLEQIKELDDHKRNHEKTEVGKNTVHAIHAAGDALNDVYWNADGSYHSTDHVLAAPVKNKEKNAPVAVMAEASDYANRKPNSIQVEYMGKEDNMPMQTSEQVSIEGAEHILPVLQHTVTHKITEETLHPLHGVVVQAQSVDQKGREKEAEENALQKEKEKLQVDFEKAEKLQQKENAEQENREKEDEDEEKKEKQKKVRKEEEEKRRKTRDEKKQELQETLRKERERKKDENEKKKEEEKKKIKEDQEQKKEEQRKEMEQLRESEDNKEKEKEREIEEYKEKQQKIVDERLKMMEESRELQKLRKQKEIEQGILLEQQGREEREKLRQQKLQELQKLKEEEEEKEKQTNQSSEDKYQPDTSKQTKLQETQGAKVLSAKPSGFEETSASKPTLNELNTDESPPLRISCADKNRNTEIHHNLFDCGDNNVQKIPSVPFVGPIIGDISLFQLSALNAHNSYRRTHQASALRLNQQMSLEATEYAKKIAKLGSLNHSGTDDGENIATVCRNKNMLMTGQEASNIWYREVCDPGYDFATAQPGNAGHFTQVIWKDSKEFGIGRAAEMRNGLLCTYIVARYRPAGNFINEFAENVPRGLFLSQQCINLARKDEILPDPRFNYKRSDIPKIRKPRTLRNVSEELTEVDKRRGTEESRRRSTQEIRRRGTKEDGHRSTETGRRHGTKVGRRRGIKRDRHRRTERRRDIVRNNSLRRQKLLVVKKTSKIVSGFSNRSTTKRKRRGKTNMAEKSQKKHHKSTRSRKYVARAQKKDEMPHQVIVPFSNAISTDGSTMRKRRRGKGRKKEEDRYLEYGPSDKLYYNNKKHGFPTFNSSMSDYEKGKINDAETPEDVIGHELKQPPMVAIKHVDESKGPAAELNHLFRLKFSENSGVIVPPLLAARRNVGCDINSNQPKCEQTVVPLSMESLGLPNGHVVSEPYSQKVESSVQHHDNVGASSALYSSTAPVLHKNEASVSVAKRLGIDLLKGSKYDDNRKLLALSALAAQAKLPSDLLLGDSSGGESQQILKMAKIGSIALQLAKKKALQRKLAEKINSSPLQGYDLLNRIQQTESKTAQPLALLNDQNGVPLNAPQKIGDCTGRRNCVLNNAIASAVENTFKSLARQSVATTSSNFNNTVSPVTDAVVKPSATGGTSGSEESSQEQEFVEATLNAHNAYRNVHDADPLRLDSNLNQEADARAKALADIGDLKRSEVENKEGENLAMSCKDGTRREKMTGPDATMLWYNQICTPEFVFDVERPQRNSDQFTQVVWKDTEKLGVGRSTFMKNGNFCTIIVARYFPSASKLHVRSNVKQGSYDPLSYCNGLGAVVDVGDNGQKKSDALEGVSLNTEDFRQEAANLQNELRAVHLSPSMLLNEALCLEAEAYATKLAEEGGTQRSNTSEGESIIKSCTTNKVEMNGDEAVRKWYNEVCNPGYSFLSDEPAGGTSSFTQMVWKSTTLFGIGKATSQEDGMFCTYIVARYREKGNVPGRYKSDVLKGRFDFGYCESLGKPHRRSKGDYFSQTKVDGSGSKRQLSKESMLDISESWRHLSNTSNVDSPLSERHLANESIVDSSGWNKPLVNESKAIFSFPLQTISNNSKEAVKKDSEASSSKDRNTRSSVIEKNSTTELQWRAVDLMDPQSLDNNTERRDDVKTEKDTLTKVTKDKFKVTTEKKSKKKKRQKLAHHNKKKRSEKLSHLLFNVRKMKDDDGISYNLMKFNKIMTKLIKRKKKPKRRKDLRGKHYIIHVTNH